MVAVPVMGVLSSHARPFRPQRAQSGMLVQRRAVRSAGVGPPEETVLEMQRTIGNAGNPRVALLLRVMKVALAQEVADACYISTRSVPSQNVFTSEGVPQAGERLAVKRTHAAIDLKDPSSANLESTLPMHRQREDHPALPKDDRRLRPRGY